MEVKPRYTNPIVSTPTEVDIPQTQGPRSILYENRIAIIVIVLLVIIIFVAAYFIFKTTAEVPPPSGDVDSPKSRTSTAPTPQQLAKENLELERLVHVIDTTPLVVQQPQTTPNVKVDAPVIAGDATEDQDAIASTEVASAELTPTEFTPNELTSAELTPNELTPTQRSTNVCGYELANGATCKVKTKHGGHCSKHK